MDDRASAADLQAAEEINKPGKSRVLYFDVLNIISCIAVVIMHVNSSYWSFSTAKRWIVFLFIDCMFYFAVPVFYMLSGATLMDYRERYSTKAYLKKRFSKTLIPFLFWSVFSIIWSTLIIKDLAPASDYLNVKSFINTIVNTKDPTQIYWFFIPLFAIYLLIPILSLIPKQKRSKAFLYLGIYGIITVSILPLAFDIFGLEYNNTIGLSFAGGNIIFTLAGYYFANNKLSKKQRLIIYIAGICGVALRFFGTAYLSYKDGSVNSMFGGYTNITGVLFGISVFVWFQYRDWSFLEKPKVYKIVRSLSAASFGVYLIHFLIIRLCFNQLGFDSVSWKWHIVGVPIVYLGSLIIVLILKRIPVLKKIVP